MPSVCTGKARLANVSSAENRRLATEEGEGGASPRPPVSARASSAAVRSLNGAEYDTHCVHPPRCRLPVTPVTVDPLIHGEPLVPSTKPLHQNDGKPSGFIPVLFWQPIGVPPTWAG